MTEIPSMEMPEWIRNPGEFDIRNILQDSLCYLASGLHGHFVKYYMGNAYSFVYIDYDESRERLLQDMAEYGFKGYRVIRQESIDPYRLHSGGWDALSMVLPRGRSARREAVRSLPGRPRKRLLRRISRHSEYFVEEGFARRGRR